MAGKPLDAAAAANKLISRAQNAGGDWLAGVTGQTVNPAELAVKAKEKWKARMMAAIQNDTWAKRLSQVSLSDITSAANKAGASAYTSGIANRSDKIMKAFQRIIPKIQAVRDIVNAMPDVTEVDRENKMLANVRGLRKIKGT